MLSLCHREENILWTRWVSDKSCVSQMQLFILDKENFTFPSQPGGVNISCSDWAACEYCGTGEGPKTASGARSRRVRTRHALTSESPKVSNNNWKKIAAFVASRFFEKESLEGSECSLDTTKKLLSWQHWWHSCYCRNTARGTWAFSIVCYPMSP